MKAVGISTFGGYFVSSGTLTIPAGSLTGLIPVTVNGQQSGTFFVDLSNPVNGTIVDGTGQATIQLQTLTVGNFEVTPDDLRVPLGDRANFAVTWTVPVGEVWRNLNTIDVRFRKGNQIALWLRWDEAANTLALCEENDAGNGVCSPGKVLGSPDTLEASLARVFLADSSAVGSGPTGPDVTLNLAIEFLGKAKGHLYDVEVAATDDLGHADNFVTATTVHVETHPKN